MSMLRAATSETFYLTMMPQRIKSGSIVKTEKKPKKIYGPNKD
jgi:hypothetical protein